MRQYHLNHAIDIRKHIIVPESQHTIPLRLQPSVALFVPVVGEMLPTVQLDNQLRFKTNKVDDMPSNWLLSLEL